ncbi:MAG: Piwi domain-containing protein [Candidatus Bathycorpusculaceae bacterium]
MNRSTNLEIFTEVFPVQIEDVPKLSSYILDIQSRRDAPIIGGKLSYRLRKKYAGHWVWTENRIITDKPKTEEEIKELIKELWHEQPDIYRDLEAVKREADGHTKPKVLADFVARGLIVDIDSKIKSILAKKAVNIGSVRIERIYETRGWVVNGRPSISISIASRLIYNKELTEYASKVSPCEDLIGIWVAAKTSSLKGEIIGIAGKLKDHRTRLLALTQEEDMQSLIENAPDDEIVVRVRAGRSEYDYPVSTLRIIVRNEDFHRFNVDSQKALKALRIEPQLRSHLIKEIASIVQESLPVGDHYNSHDSPELFITSKDVKFEPHLRFGKNQICEYDERKLLHHLRECGIYKRSAKFQENVPIRIGIVNALDSVNLDDFLSKMRKELQSLAFRSEFIGQEKTQGISRDTLERAIDILQKSNPDLLLAFFPDEYDDDEGEWGSYHIFKSIVIGRGIPSQVVYHSTLSNQYAMANIVLGILGKTGNIPFILAEPLPYADLVVGIDIARERKKRLPGSINATAIARIYFSNGEFLRYVIHDAPLEGEVIPDNVLQSLFPLNQFKNKRVVIHRDGYFRGDEEEALSDWAEKIEAKFYFVEVIKTGTPRLYGLSEGRVQQPSKGSAFILSATEAFLVSSLPPFAEATPQPLRIQTKLPFTIEQAIHSVLSLTLLHYGSLRPPRVPVTIHYSDKIAYLALRGIKPKELEGNVPFWL